MGSVVGTSKRWKGPAGGDWRSARDLLTRVDKRIADSFPAFAIDSDHPNRQGGETAEATRDRLVTQIDDVARTVADRLLTGLAQIVSEDPDALDLEEVIARDAERLVDTLDALRAEGIAAIVRLRGPTPGTRAEEFVSAFADRVSGSGSGSISDAIARRVSVRCAERLLSDGGSLSRAVETGVGEGKISGDLLCAIYAFFFADAISDYLTATIAEKIKLAFPVLYLDPTGQIAGWIAMKVIELIPNPCEEQEKSADQARSLADTAHDLIPDSIAGLLNAGE